MDDNKNSSTTPDRVIPLTGTADADYAHVNPIKIHYTNRVQEKDTADRLAGIEAQLTRIADLLQEYLKPKEFAIMESTVVPGFATADVQTLEGVTVTNQSNEMNYE